jgi:hypothetical protein
MPRLGPHHSMLTEIGRLVHFKEGKPFIIRVYQEYCPKNSRKKRKKKERKKNDAGAKSPFDNSPSNQTTTTRRLLL